MAAIVLSLALSVLLAALFWLAAGPRLALAADTRQNEVLNVFAYIGILLPFVFAVVFFLVEEL